LTTTIDATQTPAKRAPKKQEASTPRQELAAAAAAAPARAAGEPWQDEAGWTIAQPSIIFRSVWGGG
jgi:hypothetical protein